MRCSSYKVIRISPSQTSLKISLDEKRPQYSIREALSLFEIIESNNTNPEWIENFFTN